MRGDSVFDRKGLAQRLAQAVDLAGGPAKVLREANVKSSTYSRYVTGESEPSAEKLGRIAEATGASLDWLVLDRGSPIFEAGASPPQIPLGPDMAIIPYSTTHSLESAAPECARGVEKIAFPKLLLQRLNLAPEKLEFVRAAGDSMEPTIQNGALVLVDYSKREIVGDAIYVVSLDKEIRIKRVRKNIDGTISLISDNKEIYEPERLGRPDAERLRVHGRVCWTERVL